MAKDLKTLATALTNTLINDQECNFIEASAVLLHSLATLCELMSTIAIDPKQTELRKAN